MNPILFVVTQLFYAYVVCKGVRSVSGKRLTSGWIEIASYLLYTFVTGMAYLIWNIPVVTMFANILMCFLVSFNYEDKLSGRIFHAFFLIFFIGCGETFAMMVMNQTGAKIMERNKWNNDIILTSLQILSAFCVVLMIEKVAKRKEEEQFPLWQLCIFIFIALGSIYLEMVLFVELYESKPALVLVINIIITMINIAVVWIYKVLNEQYHAREKAVFGQIRNEVYENELQVMREREKTIGTLRHDMKNHCITVIEYLEKEAYGDAMNYLAKMMNKIEMEKSWLERRIAVNSDCAMYVQCIDGMVFGYYNIVRKGVGIVATTNVTMRMDEELKAQLQELVSNLGMDMTTFFTISAKQAVREQRIPFAISMDIPNADTIRTIDDVRHGRNISRAFSSVEELMEDLNAED